MTEYVMRRIVLAIMMAGAVQGAQAADYPEDLPILRGGFRDGLSPGVMRWQGFYVGGQAAYGSSDHNFNGATSDMTRQQLALTTIENEFNISSWPVIGGKVSHQSSAFGAFAGYNSQWDDTVLGVDVSYMHGNFGASAAGTMGRQFTTSDGINNSVGVTSAASIKFTDVLTLRGRAGYAIGSFLPYLFGGVAFGLADTVRSNTIDAQGTNPGPPPTNAYGPVTYTASENQNGRLKVGYTLGLGTEVMLWGNVFGRAEWEYIRFTGPIDTNINTVRGGLGYRF
jgi:outer membrane immunogenic protein